MSFFRITGIFLVGCALGACNKKSANAYLENAESPSVIASSVQNTPDQLKSSSTSVISKPLPMLSVRKPTPDDGIQIIQLSQDSDRSRFVALGNGYEVSFKSTGITLSYQLTETPSNPKAELPSGPSNESISINFINSDPDIEGEGVTPVASKISTLKGTILSTVTAYEGVCFPNVYPGIDLHYIDSGSEFSFVFVVHPGADSSLIRFSVTGGNETFIDKEGSLITKKSHGTFDVSKPITFQSFESGETIVNSDFAVTSDSSGGLSLTETDVVAINVGTYAAAAPLIIDPTISFATLLDTKQATKLAVESGSGDIYIAGQSKNNDTGVFHIARHSGIDGSLISRCAARPICNCNRCLYNWRRSNSVFRHFRICAIFSARTDCWPK